MLDFVSFSVLNALIIVRKLSRIRFILHPVQCVLNEQVHDGKRQDKILCNKFFKTFLKEKSIW